VKFKFYLRKSSFKKDKESAKILLNEIKNYKPKNFLEVGVFQGVTSRNVCEMLKKLHENNFKYYGVDIFEDTDEKTDLKESTLKSNKISNPFKHFIFNIILKAKLEFIRKCQKIIKKI
jgi:predicted ATP-grasp superfamily ATP-dependent carboligase